MDKVKDTVGSTVKKVLTKKPEMLEEQIRDKVPVEKEKKMKKFREVLAETSRGGGGMQPQYGRYAVGYSPLSLVK